MSRGRFLWVLSSKILTKIMPAHPYGSWVMATAQLLNVFLDLKDIKKIDYFSRIKLLPINIRYYFISWTY